MSSDLLYNVSPWFHNVLSSVNEIFLNELEYIKGFHCKKLVDKWLLFQSIHIYIYIFVIVEILRHF